MGAFDAVSRIVAGAVGVVSPAAASRYLAGRYQLAQQLGYAAGRRDGSNGRWGLHDQNVNVLHGRDRAVIQSRARALVRDNPNLSGALLKMTANVIYTGIRPQVQIMDRNGLPFTAANNAVEADWSNWADEADWHDLACVALRHCWTDGGCLVH